MSISQKRACQKFIVCIFRSWSFKMLLIKLDCFQFEEDKGTMMQKLSVQMLCYQLDTTWQFFTRTFKMQVEPSRNINAWNIWTQDFISLQDHLYVQYVEITVFQAEFHQVSNKFKDNESLIHSICESGSHLADVNSELDKLESMMEVILGLNAAISTMNNWI